MSEVQLIATNSTAFELPQNYSILINKLEQLALGLDSAFGNISVERHEFEIAVSGEPPEDVLSVGAPIAAGRAPPPHHGQHMGGGGEVEYPHVVSDIWIGVILTLLIVSVIFFICSCFLYHKFQQWKNSYRTSHNESVEICRRYAPDFEAESLPSYTIVSGLPTYDDALEEFRKAGIILTPHMPVIKIFESDSKESQIYNLESGLNEVASDNISLNSTCTCGAGGAVIGPNLHTPNNSVASLISNSTATPTSQIIELSPEQLATLSRKRLSLQIAFSQSINQSVRRNSRPRIDLYRQANRNNLLRSYANGHTTGGMCVEGLPQIHRSSSTFSLANEVISHNPRMQQHRGSLC